MVSVGEGSVGSAPASPQFLTASYRFLPLLITASRFSSLLTASDRYLPLLTTKRPCLLLRRYLPLLTTKQPCLLLHRYLPLLTTKQPCLLLHRLLEIPQKGGDLFLQPLVLLSHLPQLHLVLRAHALQLPFYRLSRHVGYDAVQQRAHAHMWLMWLSRDVERVWLMWLSRGCHVAVTWHGGVAVTCLSRVCHVAVT